MTATNDDFTFINDSDVESTTSFSSWALVSDEEQEHTEQEQEVVALPSMTCGICLTASAEVWFCEQHGACPDCWERYIELEASDAGLAMRRVRCFACRAEVEGWEEDPKAWARYREMLELRAPRAWQSCCSRATELHEEFVRSKAVAVPEAVRRAINAFVREGAGAADAQPVVDALEAAKILDRGEWCDDGRMLETVLRSFERFPLQKTWFLHQLFKDSQQPSQVKSCRCLFCHRCGWRWSGDEARTQRHWCDREAEVFFSWSDDAVSTSGRDADVDGIGACPTCNVTFARFGGCSAVVCPFDRTQFYIACASERQ